jgi:hypothetical protein
MNNYNNYRINEGFQLYYQCQVKIAIERLFG